MFYDNIMFLKHFFEVDLKIKKEIFNMAPDERFKDNDSLVKYVDDLDEKITYIFTELKEISLHLWKNDTLSFYSLCNLEQTIKRELYSCGTDYYKLNLFYKNRISNIRLEFTNLIKQNCVGYKLEKNNLMNFSNSINEVLHYLHSYIINDEKLLESILITYSKRTDFNSVIALRGKPVDVFKNLYEKFPSDINVGMTDMVVINDSKLLIMIRDVGHALTFEITVKKDICEVDYFIPKICNIDMVNLLPGINKVKDNSFGAIGKFNVSVSELPNTLYNFIRKVPTDDDLVMSKFSI